ncbi:phage baseplate protein [Xenorhabdus miraniensis]|uniref:Phage tail protein n=1 Tax=Xenorhabdus miraniensis TaxID=351674 RepID=A0A2D0JLJ1_9GAMM|nr:phage tail protein [Xenorhabdus miraniensis]PHM47178.1 phage tail protein [Xenorhabdus miraniensis]
MTKTFKVPFAAQGDRVSIPDEAQPNGVVSYAQGYGEAYGRDQNEDPTARDIEREKMNGIFHDITEAVGEMQTFGAAQWTAEAQPYPLRGLVYHKQKLWQSRIENNKEEPKAGNAWVELKADLTADDVGAYSKEESNDRFQAKGNYAPAGDYATNASLNGKLDKSAIVQTTGQSANQIMSQKAVTDALSSTVSINTLYPIGIILWFAQNKNPNHLFPGTTWKYIGENRTIRLAAINGSDVLSTGGRDSLSLTESQLPAHEHSFSATTSSFDYGTKSTTIEGNHTHSYTTQYSDGDSQSNPNLSRSYTWGYPETHSGAIGYSGEHSHMVYIGDHSHTISGITATAGASSAINIANAYVMLMGWYRTA